MRPFVMLLALILVPCVGGCSVFRGAAFDVLIKAQAPPPPRGTRIKLENYPFLSFGNPSVRATFETDASADVVLAFYREELAANGWREEDATLTRGPPVQAAHAASGQESYRFERTRTVGWEDFKWCYAREEIQLVLWDHRLFRTQRQDKTVASVMLIGHYAWDAPGTLVAKSLTVLGYPWGITLGMPW